MSTLMRNLGTQPEEAISLPASWVAITFGLNVLIREGTYRPWLGQRLCKSALGWLGRMIPTGRSFQFPFYASVEVTTP